MSRERTAPVLLIHGALCDASIWQPQVSVLRRAGWAVCAPTLRGFNAPRPMATTITSDSHIDQLAELLVCLGRPAHVVGHSRGGRLALHLAADFPDLVESLVLAEPGGAREQGFLPDELPSSPPPLFPSARVSNSDREALAREYIVAGHGEEAWAQLSPLFRKAALRNVQTLRFTVPDRSRPLARPVARRIRCATSIIIGDASPPLFLQIGRALEEEIPGGRLMILEGADHFAPTNKPSAFNAVMQSFLDERS
ncbi:alpha/beta hydrolase [Brevundimonas sp.]|uniref:alpha/beta fold hydrolase n=1 Tax=Brevundimonas sp. TaxID=1871086 RepID=UPI002603DCF7|nr:alpha/beta hydrolase [Brevundimonas sp.]